MPIMPFKLGPLEVGLILIILPVYFLPTLIAFIRRKTNRLPIFLLNLFAGWTVLGWIGALIWGATSDKGKN